MNRAICLSLTLLLVLWGSGGQPARADDPLPASVDLRAGFTQWELPPRAQGARNTCSVFVTVGAFEYALSKREGKGVPLSVEYANWAANRTIRNTKVDRGQFFNDILKGYEKYGLCRESLMPYEEKFQNSAPSPDAKTDARTNLERGFEVHWIRPWSDKSSLTDEQFSEIRKTLAQGWPVCAGSDHSRLFVGYVDDAQQPGSGTFVTRDSALGGYGEVTYEWTRQHVYDLFWIELKEKPPAAPEQPNDAPAIR